MNVKFTRTVTAIYLVNIHGSYIFDIISWIEIDAHAQSIVSDVSEVYPTHWALLCRKPVFVLCIQIPSICIRQASYAAMCNNSNTTRLCNFVTQALSIWTANEP